MSTFKVGEVAVGQNFQYATYRNGEECVITESLEMRAAICNVRLEIVPPCWTYKVQWSDGSTAVVRAENLRRKRPPTTGEESIIAMFRKDKQPEGETV